MKFTLLLVLGAVSTVLYGHPQPLERRVGDLVDLAIPLQITEDPTDAGIRSVSIAVRYNKMLLAPVLSERTDGDLIAEGTTVALRDGERDAEQRRVSLVVTFKEPIHRGGLLLSFPFKCLAPGVATIASDSIVAKGPTGVEYKAERATSNELTIKVAPGVRVPLQLL